MTRAVALGLLATLACTGSAVAEMSVSRTADGGVSVRADEASLEDVLSAFSRATGLEVVYDGPAPRHSITARLDDVSSTRALMRLLEGTGLAYALESDASGRQAETLLVTTATTSTPARRQAPEPRAPEPQEEEPLEDPLADPLEEPFEEPTGPALEEPQLPAAAPAFDPTRPFKPPRPTPLTFPPAVGATPTPAPQTREEILRERLEQLRQQREGEALEDQ